MTSQRRHLTQEQKRLALKAELQRDPSRSDRVIAKAVGVSQPMASAMRRSVEATDKTLQLPATTGADGKVRTRKTTVRHPNRSTVAAFAARFTVREVVALVRPIWSPMLDRSVGPPSAVEVDGATADWLRETGRAVTAPARSRAAPIALGDDPQLVHENAEPGERTWTVMELDRRAAHADDAGRTFSVGDRLLMLIHAGIAGAPGNADSLVMDETSTVDPHYPGERSVRRSYRQAPDGLGDPAAGAALRADNRLATLTGRVGEARRALLKIDGLHEHDEAAAIVADVERGLRDLAGPRGQLPRSAGALLRERMGSAELLIRMGLRRRDAAAVASQRANARSRATDARHDRATATKARVLEAAARLRARGMAERGLASTIARTLQLDASTVRRILRKT